MQFLLIICHDAGFAPTETLVTEIVGWDEEMDRKGIRLDGNPLRPPGDAVTVRVRDGKVVVTDGPFTDTDEKMAAYELIECATRDEAIEVASRHPMAKAGTIEIRPIWTDLTSQTRNP